MSTSDGKLSLQGSSQGSLQKMRGGTISFKGADDPWPQSKKPVQGPLHLQRAPGALDIVAASNRRRTQSLSREDGPLLNIRERKESIRERKESVRERKESVRERKESRGRRGSENPEIRKISVPTGWDIHGRRDTNTAWPMGIKKIWHRGKFLNDDQSTSYQSSYQMMQPSILLENTYKMEPDYKFESHKVKKMMENVLEGYLGDSVYDTSGMGQCAATISDIIKEKVKLMRYDRYKIIAWVVIGQRGSNDVRIASKGIWDSGRDSFAEVVYENKSLYAIAVVYGIYQE